MRVSASPRHGKHVTRPITCSTPAHPDCRAPRHNPVGGAALTDRVTALARLHTIIDAELGRTIDRAMLCAESLAALSARYHDLLDGRFDAILDAWRARAYGSRGAKVEWDSVAGVRTGITEGIDDMGALLVRSEQTLERIVAGEVRWGIYGSGR